MGRPSKVEGDNWRVVWRRDYTDSGDPIDDPIDPDSITLDAGAVALFPGDPTRLLVTEELNSRFLGMLTCDNTYVYRLSDGVADESFGYLFKWPLESPRIEVAEVAGESVAVINTSRGVHCVSANDTGTLPDILESGDVHALDLVVGTHGGRTVVATVWCDPDGPGVRGQAYDLATGTPVADPWPLPWGDDWSFPEKWSLGRWDGRPVVAVADSTCLYLYCAITGDRKEIIVLENNWSPRAPYGPGLLTVDDRAGPPLAVVGQFDGAVWCYDLAAQAVWCPPLTGYPGALSGARLGRWRDRPVAALLTATGISLYDLRSQGWISHVDLGAQVHDVAFAPEGRLAVVAATGPMVIDVLP